jgi:4-hydroxybenzoyl-CoA reductase subunit beta
MLRLRPFELKTPATVDAAIELLAEYAGRAKLIAGGTDLLPNMKLLQNDPEILVSLQGVAELVKIERLPTNGHDEVVIGAGVKLVDVAESELICRLLPTLAHAAGRIAGPQIRNMGTLGGNLCLDTRCRYINQSELFRDALGGCLKSHGVECHVVPGGQGCVAALSSDTAPVLIALGATLRVAGAEGRRELPVAALYNTDGLAHTNLVAGEMITSVRVPIPASDTRLTYRKWAVRKSIDFPLVSVATRLDLDDTGNLAGGVLVVSVLGPKPRVLKLDKFAGRPIDPALAADLGEMAFKRCKPLPNVPYDAGYRRDRLRVEVTRSIRSLVAGNEASGK